MITMSYLNNIVIMLIMKKKNIEATIMVLMMGEISVFVAIILSIKIC